MGKKEPKKGSEKAKNNLNTESTDTPDKPLNDEAKPGKLTTDEISQNKTIAEASPEPSDSVSESVITAAAEEKTEEKAEEKAEVKVDAKSEEPAKTPELTRNDILTILKTCPGVGQVLAERIYDAGFDTREKLSTISIEDLKKIPGIGQSNAENIANGIPVAIKQFDEPKKEEKPAEKKAPGITQKAVGFVKGTFSKITGFFKGKLPKRKPEAAKPAATTPPSASGPGEKAVGEGVKPETELGSEQETAGESGKEEYFPEVGAPEEKSEVEPEHSEVTIEGSEAETSLEVQSGSDQKDALAMELSLDSSTAKRVPSESTLGTTISKKLYPDQFIPKIDTKNSSGLLLWFETSPKLRSEAGRLLFKAGYNNLEELQEAVLEDLVLVKGINQDEAKIIFQELQTLK